MIQTTLSVTAEAATTNLTTLNRVKLELNITNDASDEFLTALVNEQSEILAGLMRRRLVLESVAETFILPRNIDVDYYKIIPLELARYPVTAVASVVEDTDAALSAANYELDDEAGLLWRLNDSGNRIRFTARRTVVRYTGGYVPLTTLPRQIEVACISLIKQHWFARTRDPRLRSQNIYDVMAETYATYDAGSSDSSQPQEVIDAVARFERRPIP